MPRDGALSCYCACHNDRDAAWRLLRDLALEAEANKARADADRFRGVDAAHVTEAALACPACVDLHCPALSGPAFPIRTDWPTLPPRTPAEPLAPWVDHGEGAE